MMANFTKLSIKNLFKTGMVLLVFPVSVFAQKIRIPENNKVIVNNIDENIYVYVLPEKQNFTADLNRTYFWFSAGKIKSTQGGYSGKLLNGAYESFYPEKSLKEKGQFRKGLKKGEWRGWHPSGTIREITHWKRGRKDGSYYLFNENKQVIREGKYHNDMFSGKSYTYLPGDSIQMIKYRKDKEIRMKERKMGRRLNDFYKRIFKGKKLASKSQQLPTAPNK